MSKVIVVAFEGSLQGNEKLIVISHDEWPAQRIDS